MTIEHHTDNFGQAPEVETTEQLTKNRCPKCGGTQVYFRVKTDDFMCRSCGEPFTKEGSEPDDEMERRTR